MRRAIEPTLELKVDEDTHGCVSSFFPRRAGVVVLLGDGDAVVLISAAGDLRAFLSDRLDEEIERDGRRADLRPVTKRILAYCCGIGMETQWLLGRIAMERDEDLLRELMERSSAQMLVLHSDPMRWSVIDSTRMQGAIGRWIGPIPKESVARRIGEALDELFSLCRYPKELALAPNGNACAYKEMGKCPAACDGSETMEQYAERFDAAWELINGGLDAAVERSERAMGEASSAMDFEAAGRHKRAAELLSAVPRSERTLARSLDRMLILVIAPCALRGWAGVWVMGEDGLTMIACVRDDAPRSTVSSVVDRASRIDPLVSLDMRSAHDLGLVSRVAHAKPGRGNRRVPSVFHLTDAIETGAVQRAIVHASTPSEQDGTRSGS